MIDLMSRKILVPIFHGIEVEFVQVNIDLQSAESIGRNDAKKREQWVRVRSAMEPLGLRGGVTQWFTPSGARALGGVADLGIAMGILQRNFARSPKRSASSVVVLGALGYSGRTTAERGVAAAAMVAFDLGFPVVAAAHHRGEIASVMGWRKSKGEFPGVAYAVTDVLEVMDRDTLDPIAPAEMKMAPRYAEPVEWGDELIRRDLQDVIKSCGSVVVFQSGRHIDLLRSVRAICANLNYISVAEKVKIASVAGLLNGSVDMLSVPVRAPHYTVSEAGLIGGGTQGRPGEVTLAHGGALVLLDVQEFAPRSIGAVMNAHRARVARLRDVVYPARFGLIATASFCPRGCIRECRCTNDELLQHRDRVRALGFDRAIVVTAHRRGP